MKSGQLLVAGLVVLVAAVLAFQVLPNASLLQQAPSDHAAVAANMRVTDTTLGVTYLPTFVRSGETAPLSMIQLSFVGKVKYSLWEFRADPNDASTVYAVMLVWGPGTGNEYFVEVGRLSANAFTLYYAGKGNMYWQQGGNDGFWCFTVQGV